MIDPSNVLIRVSGSGRIWSVTAGGYLGPDDASHPFVIDVASEAALFDRLAAMGASVPLTIAALDAAVRDHIDAVARERNFDNANDAAGFANSTQAEWSAETLAFIAWRDSVWLAFDAAKGKMPATAADFIASLPVIQWPAAG